MKNPFVFYGTTTSFGVTTSKYKFRNLCLVISLGDEDEATGQKLPFNKESLHISFSSSNGKPMKKSDMSDALSYFGFQVRKPYQEFEKVSLLNPSDKYVVHHFIQIQEKAPYAN